MSIRDERFTELEEYIAAGYGDTRPSKIPKDWRTRIPSMQVSQFFTEKPQPVEKRRMDQSPDRCRRTQRRAEENS